MVQFRKARRQPLRRRKAKRTASDSGTKLRLEVQCLSGTWVNEGEYDLVSFLARYSEGLWGPDKERVSKLLVGCTYESGGGASPCWRVTCLEA